MSDLTEKQKLFILEYMIDGNATRSAIAAGYSEDTAYSIGSENLRKPEIANEINRRRAQQAAKLEITAESVLQELAKMAFVDPRNFFHPDGSLKAINELDDTTAMALAGMDVEEAYEHFGKGQAKPIGTIKKIKIADKGQNLERLGRHLKLFTDRVEQGASDELAALIEKAFQRA